MIKVCTVKIGGRCLKMFRTTVPLLFANMIVSSYGIWLNNETAQVCNNLHKCYIVYVCMYIYTIYIYVNMYICIISFS